jgi:hypothetical protein
MLISVFSSLLGTSLRIVNPCSRVGMIEQVLVTVDFEGFGSSILVDGRRVCKQIASDPLTISPNFSG